jgi:hypothetical protein
LRPTAVFVAAAAIALSPFDIVPAHAQAPAAAAPPAAPASAEPAWRDWYACAALMERTLPLTDALLVQLRDLARTDTEAASLLPTFEKEWSQARPLVPRAAAELFAAGDRSLAAGYDGWARDRRPTPPAREALAEQDKAAARAAYASADLETVHAGLKQHRCEALVRSQRGEPS